MFPMQTNKTLITVLFPNSRYVCSPASVRLVQNRQLQACGADHCSLQQTTIIARYPTIGLRRWHAADAVEAFIIRRKGHHCNLVPAFQGIWRIPPPPDTRLASSRHPINAAGMAASIRLSEQVLAELRFWPQCFWAPASRSAWACAGSVRELACRHKG